MKRLPILLILMFVVGCAAFRGSLQLDNAGTDTKTRPADDLYILGRWLIYCGGAALALGIIARFFIQHAVVGTAILAAVGVLLLGIALSWFGQNPWAIWVIVAAVVAGIAYRHRGFLYRLFHRKGKA